VQSAFARVSKRIRRAKWPREFVIPGAQRLRRRTLAMLRSHRTSFARVLMQMPLGLNPHGSHVNGGTPSSRDEPQQAAFRSTTPWGRVPASNCLDFLHDTKPADHQASIMRCGKRVEPTFAASRMSTSHTSPIGHLVKPLGHRETLAFFMSPEARARLGDAHVTNMLVASHSRELQNCRVKTCPSDEPVMPDSRCNLCRLTSLPVVDPHNA
jgi:hypothetical protein